MLTKQPFGEFRIAETSQQVWCETGLAVNADLQHFACRHPIESLFREQNPTSEMLQAGSSTGSQRHGPIYVNGAVLISCANLHQ